MSCNVQVVDSGKSRRCGRDALWWHPDPELSAGHYCTFHKEKLEALFPVGWGVLDLGIIAIHDPENSHERTSQERMSWQDAKTIAQEWASRCGFAGDLRGKVLTLPDFEDESDCRFFLPERGLQFHKMIVKAASRAARSAGARVVLQILSAKRFEEILAQRGQEDSEEQRAFYLARQVKLEEE